uniref:Uncharacterized protein n=1 Tax=Siphoviridae sp. ct43U4 TaxID=2826285 RepID=A0A8S5MZQ0_9CAUD|nr:MAG TPA: hypothetical protein [Siphoviridae sp. ct43U4]
MRDFSKCFNLDYMMNTILIVINMMIFFRDC